MIGILVHWLISALSLLATSALVPKFKVKSFNSALIAAVVIGIANAIIRPFLLIITLPINILTLGLFTFVVNGAVLKLCAALLEGFDIEGWGAAIWGSIILSLINVIINYIGF